MKKLAVMLLAALAFVAAQAQKPTWETKIWEGTQPPTSNGITEQEYDDGQHSNKVTVPTLTVYVPQKPCGLAILDCPEEPITTFGTSPKGVQWRNGISIKESPMPF